MTQALSKKEAQTGLQALLEKAKPKIQALVPAHMSAERLIRVVLMAAQRTPAIAECRPISVLRCVMEAAQFGLMVGPPINHAHLVPFGTECQLIPDYRGLIHLARNSGELAHVAVDVVCERDEWSYYRDADGDHFRHVPAWERGKVLGAYCVARFSEGPPMIEVMSHAEIEHIRSKSRAAAKGPWVTDWAEMAKKTVIKRAAKRWPLSPERAEKFFSAVGHDNAIETGEPLEGLELDALPEASAEGPSPRLAELRAVVAPDQPPAKEPETRLDPPAEPEVAKKSGSEDDCDHAAAIKGAKAKGRTHVCSCGVEINNRGEVVEP